MTLLTVGLLVVIVALVAVIAMLLGGGPRERRGGTIDLTPAAARGELDLDWSDPRHRVAVVSDDTTLRRDVHRARLTASSA